MTDHRARVSWHHHAGDLQKGTYSRRHRVAFDGGIAFDASPAAGNVPPALVHPDCVDPEEAFVAAIASCHLLTFLYVAWRRGFRPTSYDDEAIGIMSPNAEGRRWVSAVTLAPAVTWEGTPPTAVELDSLHQEAHRECFIANSVRTEIRVVSPRTPTIETAAPARP